MTQSNTVVHADSPHVGRINVTWESINDRERMTALLAMCTLLRMEDHESGRGQTLTLVSEDLFDPLGEGQEIPEYRIESAPPGMQFENAEWESRGKSSQVGNGQSQWRFAAFRKILVRVPAIQLHMQARQVGGRPH